MRRSLIGGSAIAALIAVLGLTSGFRLAPDARSAAPSEVGIERQEGAPFEIGTVLDAQSFR